MAAWRSAGAIGRGAGAIVVIGLVIMAWYGRGDAPGLVADDWEFLLSRERNGVLHTVTGVLWRSRPVGAVVNTLFFGSIGPHPAVLFAVQSFLNAGIVVALYQLAWPHVGRARAAAVGALWVFLPNHVSLFLWASTVVAVVGFLLLVVAVVLMRDGRTALAFGLFVVAGLTYEMTIPVAALAIGVVCLLRRRWTALGVGALLLGGVSAWVVAMTPKDLTMRFAHQVFVVQSQWGWGVWDVLHAHRVVPVLLGATAAASLWFVATRRDDRDAWLVLAGAVVTAAALITVVRVRSNYVGIADRFVSLAAMGTAAVYTGAGGMLRRVAPPLTAVAAALLLVSSWRLVGDQLEAYRWADHSVRVAAAGGDPSAAPEPWRGVPGAGSEWEAVARKFLATA